MENNWHLQVRECTKHELIQLIEILVDKYGVKDEMIIWVLKTMRERFLG